MTSTKPLVIQSEETVWKALSDPTCRQLMDLIRVSPKTTGELVNEFCPNLKGFQKTFEDFSVEKITRYDMNPQAPGERTHRPRLWRDLYVVTKK